MVKKSYNTGKANGRYKDGRDSGKKMTIRLPESADERLTRLAQEAGISKNEFIIRLLIAAE